MKRAEILTLRPFHAFRAAGSPVDTKRNLDGGGIRGIEQEQVVRYTLHEKTLRVGRGLIVQSGLTQVASTTPEPIYHALPQGARILCSITAVGIVMAESIIHTEHLS